MSFRLSSSGRPLLFPFQGVEVIHQDRFLWKCLSLVGCDDAGEVRQGRELKAGRRNDPRDGQ